ncbi:MAG: GNAT family N-acetyltransferase [Actinobacteria bacterium]|nr:GNAT family N-acetyltransferase [Actinomycetota bacterium]
MSVKLQFKAERAAGDQWRRVAELRLRALTDSPEWFAGNLDKESKRSEADWRKLISNIHIVIYSHEGRDVGIMSVEEAEPIRKTDCWLGGCWIEPALRGKGITAMMIEKLDEICGEEGWQVQGLGVWPDNEIAIRAYLSTGWKKRGEPLPSRSKPGQMYQIMVRELPS